MLDDVLLVGQDDLLGHRVASCLEHLLHLRAALVLAQPLAALVARRDNGRIERDFLFCDLKRIAFLDPAAVQHAREDALARHDAVADLTPYRAALVAFLADLRDLEPDFAGAQARADRQLPEMKTLCDDVLAEGAELDIDAALAERLDLREPEEADLAVPPARMRIADHAPFRLEERFVYRRLERALLLTDAECLDRSHEYPPFYPDMLLSLSACHQPPT